jgi:hypothetical protein
MRKYGVHIGFRVSDSSSNGVRSERGSTNGP